MADGRFGWIVLQNSFWGVREKFSRVADPSPGNYVGGHMIRIRFLTERLFVSSLSSHGSPNISILTDAPRKFCRQLV